MRKVRHCFTDEESEAWALAQGHTAKSLHSWCHMCPSTTLHVVGLAFLTVTLGYRCKENTLVFQKKKSTLGTSELPVMRSHKIAKQEAANDGRGRVSK